MSRDHSAAFTTRLARKEDSKDDAIKVNQSGGTFVWRLTFATTKTVRPFHAKEIEDLCGRESVVVYIYTCICTMLCGGSTSAGGSFEPRSRFRNARVVVARHEPHANATRALRGQRNTHPTTCIRGKKKKKRLVIIIT